MSICHGTHKLKEECDCIQCKPPVDSEIHSDLYSVSPAAMSDEQIALRDAMTVTAVDQAESIAALSASLHAHLDGLCKSVERLERERNEICAANYDLVTGNHQLLEMLKELLTEIKDNDIRFMTRFISHDVIERAEKLLAGG